MAVTATFVPGTGVLTVIGDTLNNTTTISRTAAGTVLVNGGAVAVQGGTATVANTTLIQVFGQAGADILTLDEANGALPRANLFGGAGNDSMTGGSGADELFGQADNDILSGKGGNDLLFGGDGNDVLTGGDGEDQLFGQAGDDRMIWNPGDDNDVLEGGDGTDTAEVNGGNGAEVFTATANGTRVRFDRTSPAPFNLDIGTTEALVVNMNGGDDSFSATGNLAALIAVTVDGGAGNDTILGGNGADRLLGGDGNDFIDGNQGNDTAFLGAGDDVFNWDPGDGSDTVEGQDGTDKLQFNGANIAERIDISANGGRVRFTRDVASIVMDLNDVETFAFRALGGADTIHVGDLGGTDATRVAIDLAGSGGGGDGAADQVTADGSAGADAMTVTAAGSVITVAGVAAAVEISNAEFANDRLIVAGLDGADTIDAGSLAAGIVQLTLDGGTGNDVVKGSRGVDTLLGGDGDDTLTGGAGDDVLLGGAGTDRMIWNPGDGSDVLEGGDGTDTAEVNGRDVADVFTVTANGTRVRLDGTDSVAFVLDIGSTETLAVNMNGGNDSFSATGNLATLIALTVDGGAGNDTILGGNGADTLLGGDGNDFVDGNQGNDTAFLGAGDDVFNWDPGDGSDTVEGQAGADKLQFNGANINERIDISANGGRARFTRDVANIVMDLNDVETLAFRALGGADTIHVGSLGGTDVTLVDLDLGGVDLQSDQVTVDGTTGADATTVTATAGVISVSGLAARVQVSNAEAANDKLLVNGLDGNDTIDAGALAAGVVQLTLDGGAGNDVLTGSRGIDIVRGGDGDDRIVDVDSTNLDLLDGGSGVDTIDYSLVTFADGLVTIDLATGLASMQGGSSDSILNFENARGSQGGETILGSDVTNVLDGNGGNDILDGGLGADIMRGGAGDDTFFVDNAGDVTAEASNQGTDKVFSSVSYSIAGQSIEQLTLTGSANLQASGNTLANTLTGNSGNNLLEGKEGNDILDGGLGADKMRGGTGDDTFFVDNAGDLAVEAGNEGTDKVFSSVSYSIAGQSIEQLTLTGSTNINATGNTLANTLAGNSGNNVLDGKAGADTMRGGLGDDTYFVDDAGDAVREAANEGFDKVFSSVSYNLAGQSVEQITLTGSANINAHGNGLANTMVGNSGDNIIDGGAGSDTLTGGLGADTFGFRDALVANIDTITDFDVAADTIRLDRTVFAAIVGTGTLSLPQFTANTSGTARDANDRIIYETDTGKLFYDSNGSAAGGSVQFATLAPGLALTNANFSVA